MKMKIVVFGINLKLYALKIISVSLACRLGLAEFFVAFLTLEL